MKPTVGKRTRVDGPQFSSSETIHLLWDTCLRSPENWAIATLSVAFYQVTKGMNQGSGFWCGDSIFKGHCATNIN